MKHDLQYREHAPRDTGDNAQSAHGHVDRPLLPQAPTPVRAHSGNGHTTQAPRVGDPAPLVHLPDLDGTPVDLADFHGNETAVLFWNPSCGFCQQMLPELKAWEERQSGVPKLLVVSTGTMEANREQGLRSPIVLDPEFGAGQSFGVRGTPMAVLVDGEGKIASGSVAGPAAVLALLDGAPASL